MLGACVQSCFQDRGDVAVGGEEVVQHVRSGDVGKANNVIIKNVQTRWFKNIDDLFF
jgi:hypothetical protein